MVRLSGLWALSEDSLQALLARCCRCTRFAGASEFCTGWACERDIELALPVAEVWPWLAQVFRGAGSFCWPALESAERRSADYLLDDLPPPRLGDAWGRWLELEALEPGRRLCWRFRDECEVLGFTESGLRIEYRVEPRSASTCRVASSVRTAARHLTAPVSCYLRSTVDRILPAFQLVRIRASAESYGRRLPEGDINRSRVREHQVRGFMPGPPGDTDGLG